MFRIRAYTVSKIETNNMYINGRHRDLGLYTNFNPRVELCLHTATIVFSRGERGIETNYNKRIKIGIDTLIPVPSVSIRNVSCYLANSLYK